MTAFIGSWLGALPKTGCGLAVWQTSCACGPLAAVLVRRKLLEIHIRRHCGVADIQRKRDRSSCHRCLGNQNFDLIDAYHLQRSRTREENCGGKRGWGVHGPGSQGG